MFYFSLYSFCECFTFLCDVSVPLCSNSTSLCGYIVYFCNFSFLVRLYLCLFCIFFCKMISVSSCHFEIFVHISFYNSLLCLCGNFVRCFILFFLFWYMFLVILYLHFASYSFCDIIILLYYFINQDMIQITPLWLCQLHYCHHPQLILFAYEGWSQEFEVEQTQRSNRNISLPTRVTS